MRLSLRRAAVPAALATLVVVPAVAAEPVADARYEGQTSQGEQLPVRRSASARARPASSGCSRSSARRRATSSEQGTQGSLRIERIAIADGAFATSGKEAARLAPAGDFEGGRQIERYRVIGHFPDGERARGEAADPRRDPRPVRRDRRHLHHREADLLVGRPPRRRPRATRVACAGVSPRLPDGEPAPRDGALPAAALDGLGARPFGVYLHVPFCASRCGYCDFNTYVPGEGVARDGLRRRGARRVAARGPRARRRAARRRRCSSAAARPRCCRRRSSRA